MTTLSWNSEDVGEIGIARRYTFPEVVIPTGKRAAWEIAYIRANYDEIRYYTGATHKQLKRFLRFCDGLVDLTAVAGSESDPCQCVHDRMMWVGSKLNIVGVPEWERTEAGSAIRLIDLLAISLTFDDIAMDEWFGMSRDGFTREPVAQIWKCHHCTGNAEGFLINTQHAFFKEDAVSAYDFTQTIRHAGLNPMVLYSHRTQHWMNLTHLFSFADMPYSALTGAIIRLLEASGYDDCILDLEFPINAALARLTFDKARRTRIDGRRSSVSDSYLATVIVLAASQTDSERLPDLLRVVGDETRLRALTGHLAANAGRFHLHDGALLPIILDLVENGVDPELGRVLIDSQIQQITV